MLASRLTRLDASSQEQLRIALTRPSGWDGGICEINYCYDLLGDATLVINKSCEPTELQFPERGTRVWGGYCRLVSLG
jgi:hypothetical protein